MAARDVRDYEAELASRGALTSWAVKYYRARDHLQWLDAELLWLEREQAGHLFAAELEDGTGDIVVKVDRPDPIPLRWHAIVGDCVQSYRHALDHVIWRLAIVALDGKKPPTTTEFPIFNDRDLFTRDAPRKIGCLRPETQALIKGLQPYEGGDQALWTLHELSRRDKHRALLIGARVLDGGHFTIRTEHGVYTQSPVPGPLVAGTEVARIPAPLYTAASKMEMEQDLPPVVAFDEPAVFPSYVGVMDTLRRIDTAVIDTLNRVQAEFNVPNLRIPTPGDHRATAALSPGGS